MWNGDGEQEEVKWPGLRRMEYTYSKKGKIMATADTRREEETWFERKARSFISVHHLCSQFRMTYRDIRQHQEMIRLAKIYNIFTLQFVRIRLNVMQQ